MPTARASRGERLAPHGRDDACPAARAGRAATTHLRQDTGDIPEGPDIESFYRKVGRRQSPQAEADHAREQVHAVFTVLGEAISADELRTAIAQLSKDHRELLAPTA